jgi:[acyl-carrier-protein] S-malonyltransferase
MSLAFVFPGQGSQAIGMLSALAESYPQVAATFQEASDALGYDLWNIVTHGPVEELNNTQITQPAMLAAGIAVWRIWEAEGGATPVVMAGHSLGEYSALVAAGVLGFADAIKLVAERGRLMQEAVPVGQGAMAAILGLDDQAVKDVCTAAAEGEILSAVNFNAPGQVVIAGTATAIERAVVAAKDAGAKRAIQLPVSVPSHCALMAGAAERLAVQLASITLNMPTIPVINNVDVAQVSSVDGIRTALARQLYQPVRWVETVQKMADDGVDTLIECGPGKVLVGLNKRIAKDMLALAIFDPESLQKALESVKS